jgi:hypothetical protein
MLLSRMLIKFMPSNSEVEFDDLYSAGLLELTKQMDRLYTDPKLIKRLWNPKKKDLTVGPFFLKGVNSPYINQRDSASLKLDCRKIIFLQYFGGVGILHDTGRKIIINTLFLAIKDPRSVFL